jgi:hypothetical protein
MLPEVRLVVQLAIGATFLYSTLMKVRNPARFAQGLKDYGILPLGLSYPVALVFIVLEGFLAISHLTGSALRIGVPTGMAMLLVFGSAVIINLYRGRALPCYCFGGQGSETISVRTLARISVLFMGEALLMVNLNHSESNYLSSQMPIGELQQAGLSLFWVAFLTIAVAWLLDLDSVVTVIWSSQTKPERPSDKNKVPAAPLRKDGLSVDFGREI